MMPGAIPGLIIELGHFAFILALLSAAVQSVLGVMGHAAAARAAIISFVLTTLAFLGLEYAFVTSDFSVAVVAANSHSLKPLLYKITGLWGNHEGSMLLWIAMLNIFGLALAWKKLVPQDDLRIRALGVQGLLAFGFIAFALFASNPFARIIPGLPEGNSLNPVLQDPGLAFHPPTLYVGYVGFSSLFSLAAGALLIGRVDRAFAAAAKPFAAIAWTALSAGIALGSAWAYYELGWGGWWFWDPVENAALIPWLTGTALIHSLAVLGARDGLKRWTVFLAVLTFSLSLLGTFIVRSGIVTSVHAFATDPARGLFILALLAIYAGGAFTLYALRVPALKMVRLYAPVSRESGIALNNLLTLTAAATVLTGTLYPTIMESLGLGQIAVGPPYYRVTVLPLAAAAFLLMAVAPLVPWKKPGRMVFLKSLPLMGLAGGTGLVLVLVSYGAQWQALVGMFLSFWLIAGSALIFKPDLKKTAIAAGHMGLGIALVGMVGSSLWRVEDVRVAQTGERFTVGRYNLHFDGVKAAFGENYAAQQGQLNVTLTNGEKIGTLLPERRIYPVSDTQTTEAAIRLSFIDDLYIVLGEQDKDGGWVIRTQVHPFIGFLWGGFAMVVMAGLAGLGASLARKTQ